MNPLQFSPTAVPASSFQTIITVCMCVCMSARKRVCVRVKKRFFHVIELYLMETGTESQPTIKLY